MPSIGSSVGRTDNGSKQCYNVLADQQVVVSLLNQIDQAQGGTKQRPLAAPKQFGFCPDDLYRAILAFQRRQQGLSVDGHIDPGGAAIGRLNSLASAGQPAAAATTATQATPPSDRFEPPYDALPENLKTTIRRTYLNKTVENANFAWVLGFPGVKNEMSLMDLMRKLDSRGELQILKDIHGRMARVAGLWENIFEILNSWDLQAGAMVSYGFDYTCANPDGLLNFMRDGGRGGVAFCEDDPTTTVHGPRDCFRELITSGPGLHVCVTQPHKRADKQYPHDVHIDVWQVVCKRQENGRCDYSYANGQFLNHMREAAPWAIKKKLGEIADAVGEAQKNLPKDIYRGPKY